MKVRIAPPWTMSPRFEWRSSGNIRQARAARPVGADEQLADDRVEPIVGLRLPGPPAGIVGIGLVIDQRVDVHAQRSGWKGARFQD